jgi:hypothetical protein
MSIPVLQDRGTQDRGTVHLSLSYHAAADNGVAVIYYR